MYLCEALNISWHNFDAGCLLFAKSHHTVLQFCVVLLLDFLNFIAKAWHSCEIGFNIFLILLMSFESTDFGSLRAGLQFAHGSVQPLQLSMYLAE